MERLDRREPVELERRMLVLVGDLLKGDISTSGDA